MCLLGVIADDLTGATDVASTLAGSGMRTVQTIGIPAGADRFDEAEALVVALKIRSVAPEDAVGQSLAALDHLRGAGAQQILFKYCSTFDSTDRGNIGPVAEALMNRLGTDISIFCPAFPANRRTIYQGHLFVGDRLLSESGMQHHPLTPMTDPDLVRVLSRQTVGRVGLVSYADVRQGTPAIAAALSRLRRDGVRHAIVDAVFDEDLMAIGAAVADLPLVTGGSGIALGLPENFRRRGLLAWHRTDGADFSWVEGPAAVVSGSCSQATLAQIAEFSTRHPGFLIDPLRLAAGEDVVAAALDWAEPRLPTGPVLVYASALPERVREIQARLGRAAAGELVEQALACVARGLVGRGVRRLIVAGGETSGAVIEALGIRALRIGPQIDPGVPWTATIGGTELAIALKSGNFGAPDFFSKALRSLP